MALKVVATAILVSLLFTVIESTTYTKEQFYCALGWQESSNKQSDWGIGDNGKAHGPYQIHFIYWLDTKYLSLKKGNTAVNRAAYKMDVMSFTGAKKVVDKYMKRWAKAAWSDTMSINDVEKCAKIHNGGPKGPTKQSTDGYWNSFKGYLKDKCTSVQPQIKSPPPPPKQLKSSNPSNPSNPSSSSGSSNPTSLSENGAKLIKGYEGLKLTAYLDIANVPTIGYGHTKGITKADVTNKKTITLQEAEGYFKSDVQAFEKCVSDNVKVPVNQNQYDALVSLAYNIGCTAFKASTLLKRLSAKKYNEAADQFLVWNKVTKGGKKVVSQGLKNRREKEKALYETPVNKANSGYYDLLDEDVENEYVDGSELYQLNYYDQFELNGYEPYYQYKPEQYLYSPGVNDFEFNSVGLYLPFILMAVCVLSVFCCIIGGIAGVGCYMMATKQDEGGEKKKGVPHYEQV